MKNRTKNFEIQTKLGSGSYGVIYKAMNKVTREVCVLKQISLGRLSEKAKKSAINEATIMGKLVHPFIVSYKQSFIEQNILNIVMEYCDNGDLNQFLKLQNRRPLKQQKIWRFFLEICIGLQYIHKNRILHRDIKTLNIFMNKNEEIKIGDLGVAKMLTSNDFAQTMVGTPFYLSPELCEEKPYNEKSDIWAMGCLLYELCTFRHPFEAQNQGSLILKIVRGKYAPIPESYSKDLKEIIDLCLERDYKRRPTTSNILSRPKIKEIIEQLGLHKLIDEEMKKIAKEKEQIKANVDNNNKSTNEKAVIPINKQPQKTVKALDNEPQKILKAMDSDSKPEIKKQQNKKVYIIKKEEQKKEEPKREPVIIFPKPMSQRKIQIAEFKQANQPSKAKQNKNQFISNLEKMMEEDEKKNKIAKNQYPQLPIRHSDIKKEERIQKVAEKVDQLKKDHSKHSEAEKNSNVSDPKRFTPSVPEKKPSFSNDAVNRSKPPLLPSKPPIPPSAQQNKEKITKVKNQRVVQPKVYDSQKNILKPSGIIKSGGFSTNIEPDRPSKEKVEPSSKEKILSVKRASNPSIKIEKEKEPSQKQLFGPSMTPTPSVQHKSERNLRNLVSPSIFEEKKEFKKEEVNKISRVRKGVKHELSRNARNASRYTQISKEEEDMVMNLPTNVKSGGVQSSDSDGEVVGVKEKKLIQQLKRKSHQSQFQLKEINDDLILQKYEELMKNEETTVNEEEETLEKEEDREQEEMERQIKNQIEEQTLLDSPQKIQNEDEGNENIVEDIENGKKSNGNSDEPIEQDLDIENAEDYQYFADRVRENQFQDPENPDEMKKEEWSFDEQPQLPALQQKESPYFQPANPYLVEEQQQTTENKINYLQLKLQQNMKRQDQINKLMQIKIDECKRFIGSEKALQEILQFFRNKLHMEDDFCESDEKEIEVFLNKKGIKDHSKFQNIYKIMHFEMELQNTRKIIQRICKKLNELQQ